MHRLRRDLTAVVVVDIQKRLMDIVCRRDKVIGSLVRLLEAAKRLEVTVLATEQNRKVFGPTIDAVRERLPEEAEDKLVFSAFGCKTVRQRMEERGLKQVLLTGIMSNVCVLQSGLDALEHGLDVHVVEDAVTAADEDDHRIGIDRLRQAGAVITNTETAIYEFLERAGTDEFRACLPLLRR
ncbi:MAG: isochorismatase family protein [Planctomycetota bacterium]